MGKSDNKVLALVGMPGVGKGTCAEYIKTTHGWPIIHFGNMVYEEVERRGLDNVRDEVYVREDMRAKEGSAVLAKHAAKKAQYYFKQGKPRVVLDGLYSWSEYKFLEETLGDSLVVVALVASKQLRRKRVLNRKDSHRKYTMEQLITREIAEIENLEKGGPIAYADYTILNDEDPYKLIENLEFVLHQAKLI